MLRWIGGKTRNDHVRNQIKQEDAKGQHSRDRKDEIGMDISGEEKKTTSQEK